MSTSPIEQSRNAHETRRAARAEDEARLGLLDARLSRARLLVAGIGVGFAIGAALSLWPWAWLLWPVVAFVALVLYHARQAGALERARRARRVHDDALARMAGRPRERRGGGASFASPSHPYAVDLDLFGPSGLFPRLDAKRTDAGERRLASWLLAPADPRTIEGRQEALRELAPRIDLREELALLGEDAHAALSPERLSAWGSAEGMLATGLPRTLAFVFNAVLALSLVLGPALDQGVWPALAVLALQCAFALSLSAKVSRVVKRAEARARDLEILAGLLEQVESGGFESPALAALARSLAPGQTRLSGTIRSLARRLELLDARRNQLFAPFGMLLLWTTHLGLSVEAWRQREGTHLAPALDAVAEFEALASLAGFTFENPDYVFAELDEEGATLFDVEGLGHPLIPRETCIHNDLRLDTERPGLLVSGSNMSGKSTLLRSIGLALVLSGCGAPVCARRLRVSSLALGASIVARDSVTEGRSRFFAEIERLKQIFDLAAGDRALLFLLDEVLSGTNSHDRRIGAEAIVHGLLERGALGVVTTHDLALAEIVEGSENRLRNVHFEDRIEGEEMVFDYRMRAGIVQHSNAIALMRRVGLDV